MKAVFVVLGIVGLAHLLVGAARITGRDGAPQRRDWFDIVIGVAFVAQSVAGLVRLGGGQ